MRIHNHAGGELVPDVVDIHIAALDAALGGGARGVSALDPLGGAPVLPLVPEEFVIAGLDGIYVGGCRLAYHSNRPFAVISPF